MGRLGRHDDPRRGGPREGGTWDTAMGVAMKRALREKARKEAEQRVSAAAQGREGETCPACGAAKGQPDYRPASRVLWVCLDCGHRW